MNRRIVIALATGAMLLGGTAALAREPSESKPPMHMHKSQMDHRSDKEVATEYKSEAAQLREKAQSHRKLASLYRIRTLPKGGSYAAVAKHCDKLAQYYEGAAKEAEGVATELSKQSTATERRWSEADRKEFLELFAKRFRAGVMERP